MNILYITKLTGNSWAGPTYSVPAQIRAQSKYDNVFWYNINRKFKPEWKLEEPVCHTIDEYPKSTLKALPAPFNKPDLVIFEGMYEFALAKIVFEVWSLGVPYIVLPRGQMSSRALKSKHLKKVIANALFFNKFVEKSCAVQYLTNDESNASDKHWKAKPIILSNGVNKKSIVKNSFSTNKINITYIGRLEVDHKGLDLLLEAANKCRQLLTENNVHFNLYGPDSDNQKAKLVSYIEELNLYDVVTLFDGVFGDEKEQVLLQSDIFIMTSRYEGHPMGLIEALSYGLPCIVTRGSNMADEVLQYSAGWFAGSSVDEIVKAFKEMISDYTKVSEYSKNAIKLAQNYSWDSIACRSRGEYEKLIEGDVI